MGADGSGRKQVTFAGKARAAHKPAQCEQPSWSPDGTKIAFWRIEYSKGINAGDISSISVMNADGSGQHALRGAGIQPDWGRL
jgi:Tol biopolymer transport system component